MTITVVFKRKRVYIAIAPRIKCEQRRVHADNERERERMRERASFNKHDYPDWSAL